MEEEVLHQQSHAFSFSSCRSYVGMRMVETGDHFLELGLMSHPVDQAQGRRMKSKSFYTL